jgi:hypothetical protein
MPFSPEHPTQTPKASKGIKPISYSVSPGRVAPEAGITTFIHAFQQNPRRLDDVFFYVGIPNMSEYLTRLLLRNSTAHWKFATYTYTYTYTESYASPPGNNTLEVAVFLCAGVSLSEILTISAKT